MMRTAQPPILRLAAIFFVAAAGTICGQTITSFSPGFGSVGDKVDIFGSGFVPGVTRIRFNGVLEIVGGVVSASHYEAYVPSGATPGSLTATNVGTGNSFTTSDHFVVIGSGPYVSGFSNYFGNPGDTVYIFGAHLGTINTVKFNGVNSTGVISGIYDNQLQATVPNGATTGPITVSNPTNGTFTTISNFFLPPTITSYSTNAGIIGSSIVLTGQNLIGAMQVKFANNITSSFTIITNTRLTAVVPTNAVTGKVIVTTPAGATDPSSTPNFTVKPSVLGFTPVVGNIGTNVTVTGFNFFGATNVAFNNGNTSPTGVSYGQLSAAVPSGARTGPLIVMTTNGSFTTTSNFFLPPSISSFTPGTNLPGAIITISGQNFLGASAVAFSGVPAGFVTPTNNTTIYATNPFGVTTGPVTVTAPAGTATSSTLLYALPIISGFDPSHGLPGTNVTITGQNFLGTTNVQFNGVAAGIVSLSSNQIVVTAPAAETGPISVQAPAGKVTTATNFVYDYRSDLKLTLIDNPDPAFVGSNLLYSLIVSNIGLQAAPTVMVTNALPTNVVLKAAFVEQGSMLTNGNTIIGALGLIQPGDSIVMILTVAPQTPGALTNTASARSGYVDPNLGDNDATVTTLVLPVPMLSVQRISPTRVRVLWPVLLTNFILEHNTMFATNGWSSNTTQIVIFGDQNTVTETNSGTGKFYRLRQ